MRTSYHIISLGCYQFFDQSLKICIEAGTSNTQLYFSVNQIHSALGESMCSALPAYHASTSCKYNCLFNRKGKVRPLELLQKCKEAMSAFVKLGHVQQQKYISR